MKYKIIAIDFDGTLLDDNKKISSNNLYTLNKMKQEGYYIIGVTARNLASIKSVCDINIFDYFILNNGCNIYDVKNDTITYKKILDKKICKGLLDSIRDISNKVQLCSINYYYTIGKKDSNLKFHVKVNDYNEIDDDVCRMNIFFDDIDKVDYYNNQLQNLYPDLNIFIMKEAGSNIDQNKWLVINPSQVNKMETLKCLAESLKISMDEVIFFGDGPNDIELLEGVGLGVAMENAPDDVKSHAKKVTLSNNDDGVSYFLDKYIL